MKILVLTHEFPPVGGGGGHVARDLCEGLSDLGHEMTVLTAALAGGVREGDSDQDLPFRVIRVKTLRRDPARANLTAMISYLFSAFFRALPLIRNWKPDLIHVHFAVPSGALAWLLSRWFRLPYVLTAHLGDIPGGTPEKTDRWFQWVKPLTYPIWQGAARVVAVSSYSRQLALEHYPVEIDVIHNGVDLSLYHHDEIVVHDPPRIVFAGRFVPQKNPLLVVRTLASLKDLDWELVMMGDGELFDQVKAEIHHHGLEDRVFLPGWVSPETVKKEFLQSDILFMPSLSEGLPVVGVQALASGLGLIVSDIGGFIDLVDNGKNGCRIAGELQDPEYEYLDQFSQLLRDRDMLLDFKIQSAAKSSAFDLQVIVRSYESLFLEITAEV